MDASIKQVNRYDIEINGEVLEGFVMESEWEMFAKFSRGKDWVIVFRQSHFTRLFADIFGGDLVNTNVQVAMLSPSLQRLTADAPVTD